MISAVVAVLACLSLARPSPAQAHTHSLRAYTHTSHTAKELSSVLASIEERLRVLDTISAVQAKQARKLEVIQDKLDRVETTLSLKLERLQLAADRLEHRMHMLQTSLQASIKESSDQIQSSQTQITDIEQNLTSQLISQKTLLEKVNDGYTETSQRGQVLESLMRESLSLVNVTRREFADGLRAVARRQGGARLTLQADVESAVARQVGETTQKIDMKMQELIDNQKRFTDSCQRMQLDDPMHVADVLEKLIDSLINKTASTFHELQTIQAALRSHDTKVLKVFNSGRTIQGDATCRRLESVFRNATQASIKEQELYQLTEKFVALTDRADAALQRFEAQMAADTDETLASDVTAEADQLVHKLDGIKNEPEEDEEADISWEDSDQDDEYFDDGGGGDIMDEDKEILNRGWHSGIDNLESLPTRPPHRRHLHKHPYDRGPSWRHSTTP